MEREREEGRMESFDQEEEDSRTQDGRVQSAEDHGATVPFDQECGLQDQPEAELDRATPKPHSDHRGTDEYHTEVVENVTEVPLPHFSDLNASEDTEDHDPLQEEEEFIVLDPEHPLVRRQQAALSRQLSNELERINERLKQKQSIEKTDDKHKLEVAVELFRVQEQLARLQSRLEERHQNKAQAEAKHRQIQDQLGVVKSQYSSTTNQNKKAKSNMSQLQSEIDNLMQHLVFAQGVSEDLRSHVKALKNAKHKAGAEKTQAEEQKLKQDIYVERLMKDLERLTQQVAMYETQASAQAEETQAAKEALAEAEMEVESLAMARRQLMQQWSSSLMGMRRRDEAFSAMQDATRAVAHQGILLDREIEGYKKSVAEEQEQNETLTMQLNWSQMDGNTSKKQISQKQAQQEALHAHYTTCLRTLRETERTLSRLTKETGIHHVEVNDQRKHLEKESAVRLELEDKIMTNMQQKLTHNKAAKYSERLTSKIALLKKEKVSQLWQLENNIAVVELERSKVIQHLESLAVIQEALDEEISKKNKITTTIQANISSFVTLIAQKQSSIANYDKKIGQIVASTGRDDLSPMQIKIEALMSQSAEVTATMESVKKLWMKRQEILEEQSQEIEANSKDMFKLQKEYTGMQKERICLESQVEVEHRDKMELEKNAKTLRGDLLKLNTLISKNGQLSVALEQDNELMETDFLHRLKEAERDSIKMQMKHEKTQEEKERLLNSLLEAQQQIMLWEKKIQLVKETRSAVDIDLGQGDFQMMKTEIHRMEVRLNQLMKQQERLLRESEATVARRETIVLRREAMVHTSIKQNTKGELNRAIQCLQRKIQDTHKHVVECEQVIRDLQESRVILSDKLAQQKQQLVDVCSFSYILEPDFVNLQDTKDSNLAHLVTLQSRTKKLQGLSVGGYQALSTSESIDVATQSKMERMHTTSAILHRVCQEFPQHQGALHRLLLALAARTQVLEQEMS
ncbi:coiled-coil domain-containing protein 40 [Labrus bergylta]